ncbi:MAG: hypothetical protein FWB83_11655 [Treponema sp.]|nr:hypothetical protein [Treponema sp.]MCL2181768.1 hypothetical protein [Treponema sp.]
MGMLQILLNVITSWQVLAITLALLVFYHVVFYLARSYHRPRAIKVKEKKKKAEKAPAEVQIKDDSNSGHGDDLGLEEG